MIGGFNIFGDCCSSVHVTIWLTGAILFDKIYGWPKSAIYLTSCHCRRWTVDPKPPLGTDDASEKSSYVPPDADLDAIWRFAIGLDLGSRSVLEAEVLLSRICKAKDMPREAIERALNAEWEKE